MKNNNFSKLFYFLIILSFLGSVFVRLYEHNSWSMLIGILSYVTIVLSFFMGLRLMKLRETSGVIWSFTIPSFVYGIVGLPFGIVGLIYAKGELKKGNHFIWIPIVIFLYNTILQIIALFTLGLLFLR